MGSVVWSSPEQTASVQDIQQTPDENIAPFLPADMSQNDEPKSSRLQSIQHTSEMDEFNEYLEEKRAQRQEVISRISKQMNDLRESLGDLEKEKELRTELEKQVNALREVHTCTNEILQLRETQISELKKRLQNIEIINEESLTTLRKHYETQFENFRKLRQLYEERAEATARGHQKELEKERAKNVLLEIKLDEYMRDAMAAKELTKKVEELEKRVEGQENQISDLKSERCSLVAKSDNLTSQLSIINNMFSNILTGEMNFDAITQLLQDNHNLITDLIAHGDINDTAALLVNLAGQTYKSPSQPAETSSDDPSPTTAVDTKAEIASNLPKVWRMLVELLSNYENSSQVQGTSNECYKNVTTPSGGSRTVISVSQTFLRLKDLILEKNFLVKEVGKLKTLNGHLENRLDLQEKRLSVVSSELRKTWGVVSKLKVQHRQLHTHEKVLRYELQHKRQMLADLKHELKYCRETWDKAREKNKETEHDWELLRKEFALRKSRDVSNSAESGYEDDESSQSPDVSASELEDDDISPLSDERKLSELNLDLEDAASDATVIELIDMLDFEQDEVPPYEDDVPRVETADECVQAEENPSSQKAEVTNDGGEEASTLSNPDPLSEEVLDARAARLKRLEEQCRSLLNQMAITSLRSDTLSTRLEELHEQYASDESRRSLTRQNTERESSVTSTRSEEASSSLSRQNTTCTPSVEEDGGDESSRSFRQSVERGSSVSLTAVENESTERDTEANTDVEPANSNENNR